MVFESPIAVNHTEKKIYQIDIYNSKALKAFEKNWDILEKLLKIWETSIHIEKWGFNSTIFCGSKTSHPDWRNVKWVKKDTIWSLEPENMKMFWKKLILFKKLNKTKRNNESLWY